MTMTFLDLTGRLDQATWRKSSASGPFSDNCVEVAFLPGVTGKSGDNDADTADEDDE